MSFSKQKVKNLLASFAGAVENDKIKVENFNLDNETNVKRLEIVYTENKEAN
jgi:hypothetical protein